jgi:transposase-like protein
MKRKRHTAEEIIRKLREAEAQLAAGATVAEVSKKLGVSENTYHYGAGRLAEARDQHYPGTGTLIAPGTENGVWTLDIPVLTLSTSAV